MFQSLFIAIVSVFLLAAGVLLIVRRRKLPMSLPANAHPNELRLAPCKYRTKTGRYDADCGTLTVKENRLSPASRLLAIPVMRIHAASDSPLEPIFYLAGGPGITNMKFKPPDELLQNHDVVMVGYRGVDGSSRLDSPEFARASLGNGSDLMSDQSLAIMTDAVRQCRARLEAVNIDLTGYTIQQVVEDMEAVRLALGYRSINLLSESYGTRVAQVYAALHPASLQRSAMIGVNPPGRFVWEPAMIDRQIEAYGRLWAADEVRRGRCADLTAAMRQVARSMPPRWLTFPIDPGKVNSVAFIMLFNRSTAARVFDAYVAAAAGDASGLALMSIAYDLLVPKAFVWGEFFAKGTSADLDMRRDYAADLGAPHSIMGSPLARMVWVPLSRAWRHETLPPELRRAQPTDVETLLVSGSADFSTPAEYATNELLPSLKRGRQVIHAELGHVADLWSAQPAATVQLLTSFYDTGQADDSLYHYAPMDFNVRHGFPWLAKVLLWTGVLPAVALALRTQRLLWSIVGRPV